MRSTFVVFEGQSLHNLPNLTGFPSILMSTRMFPWTTCAISGTPITTLAISAPNRVDLHLKSAYSPFMFFNGLNSDILEDETAGDTYAEMVAYVAARRAAAPRVKIIGSTLTPATFFTGPQDVQRLALNVLLRNGAAGLFDGFVDLANAPGLTNCLDATYYVDGAHLTQVGAQAAADAISPTFRAVGIG